MELGCASVGVMDDTVTADDVTALVLNCTAGDAGLYAAAAAGKDDDDVDGCDASSKHTRLGRRTDTSPSPSTPTPKNHLSYPSVIKTMNRMRQKNYPIYSAIFCEPH